MVFDWIDKYVEELWNGILKRLQHFDSGGTTAWSEAPAEGIFSILQNICDHKSSIKLSNLTKLCRIVKEGPPPGSKDASYMTKQSINKWPSVYGARFTTSDFMKGTTSPTEAAILNK